MGVVLNEAAIEGLLASPGSPLVEVVRAATEAVERRARENAAVIIRSISMGEVVGSRFSLSPLGPAGEVGVTGGGSISRYLDEKAVRERNSGTPGDWLASSLDVLEPLGWVVTKA